MKFAKKAKIKIKFPKMKGIYLFGQHSLVEKSPTATDSHERNIVYENVPNIFWKFKFLMVFNGNGDIIIRFRRMCDVTI